MKATVAPILVTGGAGYIGSVLVSSLLTRGFTVRVIDNLMYGQNPSLIFDKRPELEFFEGDIRHDSDLGKALQGVRSVIHLAAIVGDPACEKKRDLASETNGHASELLYRLAVGKKVSRFIFASTCSNYGKMKSEDKFVTESSELKPISHYARLKVEFEKYLLGQREPGMTSVLLRFATAYGMSPRPRLDLTLNEFTTLLAQGEKLEVYGEQFWRPYCHVNDLARACVMAVEANVSKIAGRAFNVGVTQENYQKKTLVELILKELPETKSQVSYVSKQEDPRDYRVCFDFISQTLGFKNTKTVVDGIREFIKAVREGQFRDRENPLYSNC